MSAAVTNNAPPIPEFSDTESRLRYLRWLVAMSSSASSVTKVAAFAAIILSPCPQ